VQADEGQQVHRGDLLIELEPYDLREREAQQQAAWEQAKAEYTRLSNGFRDEEKLQAEARVRQWEARLEKLKVGPRPQEIETARADLEQSQALQKLAQDNYDRIQGLFKDNAATQERLDSSSGELRAAVATVAARQEQLDLLLAGTRPEEIAEAEAQLEEARQASALMQNGYRDEEVAASYAAMQEAEAALRAVQSQIAELKIESPLEGTVEAVELQPGDMVGANAPVLSLLDRESLWVRAYVPEDQLDVKVGQQVRVTVDSYPGEDFAGEISFVARQAEFTPRNVQTPEERSKQVFRIKVKLKDSERLRPGMSADVWLDQK
jgi:multidrug resistance efflux pump